jgi:hypothetical protein
VTEELSCGDALAAFRARNGLPSDEATARSWRCGIGPVAVRLPNFAWRKRAILAHDLHHVLTGYPCNLRGEFQVAAWEFAAGPMPHWGARLFCLPLVVSGLVWSPRRIWRAYCDGLSSTSLHGNRIDGALLLSPVSVVGRRAETRGTRHRWRHIRFLGLLAEAMLILCSPLLIVALAWWIAQQV